MDEIETMLNDCENRESKLTDWERNFIASLGERIGRGKRLTEAQEEHLELIWNRVTS